jgi:GT2 family glycosyltransferase
LSSGSNDGSGRADADPSVAVIIPNWNTLDVLADCIESVERGQSPAVELLVVDNGSVDGSVEFLRDEGIPLMAFDANVGFSRAVNLGVAHTTAPFVFILNADTILSPGALEALIEALRADPSLAGVQPLILQLDNGCPGDAMDPGARVYSAGQRLTRDGRGREAGIGKERASVSTAAGEVFGVCGAACLLRREPFDRLGGYDERYFAFYEDVDLNVRARVLGWGFALVPEAVVWHVGNVAWKAGFRKPDAENARLVARNRLATQLKFMSPAAIPIIFAAELCALASALMRRRFRATVRGKLQALRHAREYLSDRRDLRASGSLRAARVWRGR